MQGFYSDVSNRIRGALYGVAVGDALGAPLEFVSKEFIWESVTDMIGGGWLNVKPGEVTDDTQMTVAVARGIVENPTNPIEAIGRNFVEWMHSGPKDIGATCSSSIRKAMYLANDMKSPTSSDWEQAAKYTHNAFGGMSDGNGSLMRTAYVGIYYTDEVSVRAKAAAISRMTHFSEVAAQDCQAYSFMIYEMINETSSVRRRLIIPHILRVMQPCGDRYNVDELSGDGYVPDPTGYVVNSFKVALHCVLTTHTFEDAVIKAVNQGGDADTIGAITGGLAGALYGFDHIPDRWVKVLESDVHEEFAMLCAAAINVRR